MSDPHVILVVDDDPHIREVIRFALQKEGFETVEAANGREALEAFDRSPPSLMVLDILMPEMDGCEVCRAIRSRSDLPIVFLSSKDDEVDRIVGLELGGDDYITKPFSPRELIARIRAILRRTAGPPPPARDTASAPARTLRHGKLEVDLDRYRVVWDGAEIVLTVTEFGLLRTLMAYPEKVYTRNELMEGAYEFDTVVSGRTIDSHVRRLRKKLADAGGDPIATVHGLGYKLGPAR
ncbi:MAG: response regulator transcription factor [Acidobacteriota bacterium]|nr:response regulator transcription factor [Acidobacteriota bacterium]